MSANISWHVCSASGSFTLWSAISPVLCSLFFALFLCSILTSVSKKSLVIPDAMPGWFSFSPSLSVFYYRGGFTNVRRRFGDERDGIIPIPALPLSCSNSLTKLSDSILDPTARVNLLCHSQSTRGSAKSRSSPCQNPPTAPLFRFSLFTLCFAAYILDLFFCFLPLWSSLYIYFGDKTAWCI